jgi:hypothetical protein
MRRLGLGLLAGVGMLAASSLSAMAGIACSGNVCWHTTDRYEYPPAAGVVVHEDAWKPDPGITFREHTGRGYWRGESWTDF